MTDPDPSNAGNKPEAGEAPAAAGSTVSRERQDASVLAEAPTVVRENNQDGGDAAGGDSASLKAAETPVESALTPVSVAEGVEAIISALPPGFARCPGCPMVSSNY